MSPNRHLHVTTLVQHSPTFLHLKETAMGLGGISIWQLVIVLLIVVMLFGTRRFRSIGSDLGEAISGFRKSVATTDDTPAPQLGHGEQATREKAERHEMA